MILKLLRTIGASRAQAAQQYAAIVAQARQPKYYTDFAVADTVDGRFDMIALHLFRHLNAQPSGKDTQTLRQKLLECMIDDMDKSLREMGVGDMSVGKKVGKIAYAVNGRLHAYEASWADDEALAQALWRNVYRSDAERLNAAHALMAEIRSESTHDTTQH